MPRDLPGLTGLRGLLAFAVLLYHLGLLPGGWLAVDGFFVLSGIVLTHVYATRLDVGAFLWHRFARLAPTCIASTLIVVAVGWAQGVHFTSGDVLATLAVLPLIGHKSAVNGAMWSLAVEGVLYAAFPLLLLAMPRNRTVRRAAITVCALGAAVIAWRSFAGHGFVAGPLAVLRGLFPFVAGMLICGGWNERSRVNRLNDFNNLDTFRDNRGYSAWAIRNCHCGYGSFARRNLGRLVSILDSSPIRWLGEVSLPLYLCQIVPLRLLGQSLWVIPAALALAAAVHYAIEVPGRRWLRGLGTKKAGSDRSGRPMKATTLGR